MELNKNFLRPNRLEYLIAVASVLPSANKCQRALYLLSGGDFITSYLLSNGANEIIMVDRLPFHGITLNDSDYTRYKNEYYYKKYELNFSVEPDLLPEIGCLQYLLWELEAMGISDTNQVIHTLIEGSDSRSYTLKYQLPGDAEKYLVYYQIEDACHLKYYPEGLLQEISKGIDCLIRKAAVNLKISSEVLAFMTSSMDKQGLMFIDDESSTMLDEINTVFCPMNETAMLAIRQFETSHSILFGYNPVTIYQSIPARREWEVERRYQPGNFPKNLIFLNDNPSLDLHIIKSLLENSSIKFILVGDAEGTDRLAQHHPDQFFIETTYSPESLIKRYLCDSRTTVYILGNDDEFKYFTNFKQVKYFITSSVNYPYFNYQVEQMILLCIFNEEKIPEYERIFNPSLGSNYFWLQFNIFKHINPNNVEAEISNFAQQVMAKLSSKIELT